MIVPFDEWVAVATSPATLLAQNADQVTLALKIAGSAPTYDPDDPSADVVPGTCLLLYPGSAPVTLPASAQNYYARALGPRDGAIYTIET